MITTQQLDDMSQINLSDADKSRLIDISSVHVDTSLSAAERMKKYIEEIKNPYLFRSGNLIVRVRFTPDGADLSDVIKRHFISLKRG